jgi:predicted nucleic acid-binding protein
VEIQQEFIDTLTTGSHTYFAVIDRQTGEQAAKFRACYNLGLADALQFSVALEAGCDAFLTNDMALKRVMELNVITLNDILDM